MIRKLVYMIETLIMDIESDTLKKGCFKVRTNKVAELIDNSRNFTGYNNLGIVDMAYLKYVGKCRSANLIPLNFPV